MNACLRNVSVVAMLVLGFSSCKGSGTGPGTSQAYQSGSDNCSSVYVSDYEKLNREANNLTSYIQMLSGSSSGAQIADARQRAVTMRSNVVAFRAKYAGVACKANVAGEQKTVNTNQDCDEAIAQLDKLLKAFDQPSNSARYEVDALRSASIRVLN